jgi:hypothetical protein
MSAHTASDEARLGTGLVVSTCSTVAAAVIAADAADGIHPVCAIHLLSLFCRRQVIEIRHGLYTRNCLVSVCHFEPPFCYRRIATYGRGLQLGAQAPERGASLSPLK